MIAASPWQTPTETVPAPQTGPTDPGASSTPQPRNPYQPRRGRMRGQMRGPGYGGAPQNPWAQPDAPHGQTAQTGVQGGPNPMAMNQWGYTPQAQPASSPYAPSTAVATDTMPQPGTDPYAGALSGGAYGGVGGTAAPGATASGVAATGGASTGVTGVPDGHTITSTAPNPLGPNARASGGAGPFTGPSNAQPSVSATDLNQFWSRQPSADSVGNLDWNRYANAGAAYVQDTAAGRPAAQRNYINNAADRADQARYQAEPYQITALNRLGDFYNNNATPDLGEFTPVSADSGSDPNVAISNSMAGNAANQLAAIPTDPNQTLSYGTGIRSTLDTGRTAMLGGALDQSVQGLANQPSLSDLAKQSFDANNAASDISLQRALDEYRQQQAADGRTGLSADKGVNDILNQAMAQRNATSANLALQAAQGTAGNNLARASTLGSLYQGQQGTGLNALSLGRGLASDQVGQSQGKLSSLADYANQAFGQNQANQNAARTERGQQLAYRQQGIQNKLANNAQNWNQITQAQAIGDPYREQGAYDNLANLNFNAFANQAQIDNAQKQGLFNSFGNLATAAASLFG